MARKMLSITKMYSYDTIENAEKDIAKMCDDGYMVEWVYYDFRVDDYDGEYKDYIMDDYHDEKYKYSVKFFK